MRCLSSEIVAQFLFNFKFQKILVGTRVEPVVYVHSRHLQLRGDAAILIKPFSFFTSFKSELKQNSNFDGLYFKHKYLLLHGWYTYIGSHSATNKF